MRKTARYSALAAAGLLSLSSLTACANDAASTTADSGSNGGGGKGEHVRSWSAAWTRSSTCGRCSRSGSAYFNDEGLDVELLS